MPGSPRKTRKLHRSAPCEPEPAEGGAAHQAERRHAAALTGRPARNRLPTARSTAALVAPDLAVIVELDHAVERRATEAERQATVQRPAQLKAPTCEPAAPPGTGPSGAAVGGSSAGIRRWVPRSETCTATASIDIAAIAANMARTAGRRIQRRWALVLKTANAFGKRDMSSVARDLRFGDFDQRLVVQRLSRGEQPVRPGARVFDVLPSVLAVARVARRWHSTC